MRNGPEMTNYQMSCRFSESQAMGMFNLSSLKVKNITCRSLIPYAPFLMAFITPLLASRCKMAET